MDDTISRQTVLDAIDEISREVDDGDGFDYEKWREYFCELPSAEPKRGKWVLVCDNNGMHFICNKCGAWRYHQEQNFCGECGADMREVTT